MNKRLGTIFGILLCIIILVIGILLISSSIKKTNGPAPKLIKKGNAEVIKDFAMEEIKTSKYAEGLYDKQYIIDSNEEIHAFNNLYKDDSLNKYLNKLNKVSLFVLVKYESSGSNKIKLEGVTFENNKLDIVYEELSQEIGTDDIATWYLVVLIPNDRLEGLDLSNWEKPSTIK